MLIQRFHGSTIHLDMRIQEQETTHAGFVLQKNALQKFMVDIRKFMEIQHHFYLTFALLQTQKLIS